MRTAQTYAVLKDRHIIVRALPSMSAARKVATIHAGKAIIDPRCLPQR